MAAGGRKRNPGGGNPVKEGGEAVVEIPLRGGEGWMSKSWQVGVEAEARPLDSVRKRSTSRFPFHD